MNNKGVWNPDMISNSITLGKNIKIWEKTDGKCCYCGVQTLKLYLNRKENRANPRLATIEHIIPKSKGGTYIAKNLAIACRLCNSRKGNKSLKLFRESFGKRFFYKELNETITHCPHCKDVKLTQCIEARPTKYGDKRMRGLKPGWLACPMLACRRVVNIITGEVWKRNKLEVKGNG